MVGLKPPCRHDEVVGAQSSAATAGYDRARDSRDLRWVYILGRATQQIQTTFFSTDYPTVLTAPHCVV